MKRITLLISCILGTTVLACAQQQTHTSAIETPNSSTYFEVELPPAITSKTASDFSDVRLVDDQNMECAYYITTAEPITTATAFVPWELYNQKLYPNKTTTASYWVRNPVASANSMVLKIRNFEDYRTLQLLGSDDGKRWYIIKDRFVLYGVNRSNATFGFHVLHFPNSQYAFFRLDFADSSEEDSEKTAPLNIESIGNFENDSYHSGYTTIQPTSTKLTENLDANTTTFNFSFEDQQRVNRLKIKVANTLPYRRRFDLKKKVYTTDTTFHYLTIHSGWLCATALNQFEFNNLRLKEAQLVIYNKDDRALENVHIEAQELPSKLIAHFEKDRTYSLYFGDQLLKRPEYDIVYFKKQLAQSMPQLHVGEAIQLQQPAAVIEHKPWYQQRSFLWIAIGCATLLFGWISLRMLSELKTRNS